jgi:SNF2 family DNA or RNA helicase
MEMRLGKTFVLLVWALSLLRRDDLKLVVAPSSVLYDWLNELAIEGEQAVILSGSSANKRLQLEAGIRTGVRWFLVNPEGLRAAPDLTYAAWRLVVLDESTFIANPKAKVTKIIQRAFRDVEFKAVLTGTPAPEHDLQYFEQMRFLHGKFCGFKSYWSFRAHCWHQAGFEWYPNRGVKEMYTGELAEDAYVLSAKDAGIPDHRFYERRYVELPGQLRRLYRKITEEYTLGDLMTRWALVAQSWLAQVAGGCLPLDFRKEIHAAYSPHKFVELERLLSTELRGKPVVIYFRFNRELRITAERLRKLGLKVVGFTGLNSSQERQLAADKFQAGDARILLAQGKAARFGKNFSRASTAIFFSNWMDCLTRQQLEARTRHPLKKEPALYIDLVTKGTVDEAAVMALREKARNSYGLLRRIRELHGGLAG